MSLEPGRGRLREVALLYLKLGCIAFGGPAAHIAMMRDEVVKRRGWVSEQRFLDLVGAVSLIPGPSSTQLAIYLGMLRAGWRGLVLAGVLFIAPAMLIVVALAWAYVRFGAAPAATWLLYGIKPVILAIIAQALWGLGRTAFKGPLVTALGLAVLGLYFAGWNVILLLWGAGVLLALLRGGRAFVSRRASLGVAAVPMSLAVLAPALPPAPFDLPALFFVFLKIGATLYGSGYVLLAFLQRYLVSDLGWLNDRQLLDAVAVGQFTPGPVFTTATFIGYLLGAENQSSGGGPAAAIVATVAIFLPSFLFVPAIHPVVAGLRASPSMSAFLDGANAAAVGLMAAVTLQLGRAAVVDLPTAVLALVGLALLLRYRLNSAWLVLAGGLAGVALKLAGW